MKNKKVIYGFLVVGAIVGYYYYNIQKTGEGKIKDTRSQKEKDCDKIGGSYDRVEKFCQRM
jgi:hypothetical protein